MFKKRNAKITPSSSSSSDLGAEEKSRTSSPETTMRVMSLEILFKLYGGERHPKIESYEVMQERSCLTEYRYMPHGARVVKVLLEHGASMKYRTDHGSFILTDLCSSEDSEPELVEFLLKQSAKLSVNYRRRDAFELCEKAGPFPSVQRVLREHQQQEHKNQ